MVTAFCLFTLAVCIFAHGVASNSLEEFQRSETLATLTKANKKQKVDIYELIKKVDFDSCIAQNSKSTYTRYKAPGNKSPTYRLDNEPKTSDSPPNAKLAIQLDGVRPSPTYATIVVKPNIKFGRQRIQKALQDSVDTAEVKYLLN